VRGSQLVGDLAEPLVGGRFLGRAELAVGFSGDLGEPLGNYWTSAYVADLADDLIEQLVELNAGAPSHESTVDVWLLGGAMVQVPVHATAFGDRSAPFMLGIEANWGDAGDDGANMAWARRVREAAEPWATGARYANFPGLYEQDEAPDFFGPNRERLAALKTAYDPDNVFDRNHNVAPNPAS
jgi:hypothetical protein